jgi:outer membrane immunogenic protein
MKRFLLATTGMLALGVVAAQAADLPRAMPAKAAPVYSPVPVYNWTGPYVGINGGGGWGHASEAFSGTSHTISGGLAGATLGYNWQMGQAVFGIEGDIDWTNIRGSAACGLTSCETRNHWLGTVRGRLGYAFDRFMPYVTGGLAVGDIDHTITGVGSSRETKAGWTLGGGIEAAIANNWTAKLEYLYVDLGSGASVAGSDTNFRTNIVRAGLNYRF